MFLDPAKTNSRNILPGNGHVVNQEGISRSFSATIWNFSHIHTLQRTHARACKCADTHTQREKENERMRKLGRKGLNVHSSGMFNEVHTLEYYTGLKRTQRDGSVFKSTGCSSGDPRSIPCIHTVVPGDMTPSSGFLRYRMHTVHRHTYRPDK